MMNNLKDGERLDDLQNGYMLIQMFMYDFKFLFLCPDTFRLAFFHFFTP